jgi:outer membrane protein with beta-barrel domain
MKRRFVTCAVVLSLALLTSAAAAQGRPFKIGFGGGVSVPVSDAKDAFKNGFHGKGMVMWNAPVLPLALRGSVGYSQLDLKSLAPGVDGTGKIISGLANVSYGFPVGPVKPYIIAGVGAFNIKTEVGGTSSPSETKFGIDGGAGLEFKLGGITGFVEGKVENIFTDQGLSTAIGSAQEFKTLIVPVTFGVFF